MASKCIRTGAVLRTIALDLDRLHRSVATWQVTTYASCWNGPERYLAVLFPPPGLVMAPSISVQAPLSRNFRHAPPSPPLPSNVSTAATLLSDPCRWRPSTARGNGNVTMASRAPMHDGVAETPSCPARGISHTCRGAVRSQDDGRETAIH